MTKGIVFVWRYRGELATAMVCSLVATPAFAQKLGQAPDVEVPWLRVFGALLLCLSLAVGAAFALRARTGHPAAQAPGMRSWMHTLFPRSPGRQDRRLKLVETLRLSAQVELCLVCCDGCEFTLALTPQGACVLPMIQPPEGSAQIR